MTQDQQPVSKSELLRAVYRSVEWDRLYDLLPGATREQVDALFAEFREALGACPDVPAELAAVIAGGSVSVHCDGASRGNPGPAGIGVVLRTPGGQDVVAWGESIGRATNNVAEYLACIAGLRKALELQARSVTILSDSQLLVRQINGRYRVKNPGLKPLHAQVGELLSHFDSWEARHVPREQNAEADALASKAAKKG